MPTEQYLVKFWADGGMLGGHNPSPEGVYWSVYRHCPGRRRRGKLIISRAQSTQYHTNNDAEWLAVRAALTFALKWHKGGRIRIYSDSRLIVHQFSGKWRCKVARLFRLMYECQQLATNFTECKVEWRPRLEMVGYLGH